MAVEWLRISGGGRDASVVATASAASAAVLLLEIACRLILLVSDALSIPLRRIPKRRVPREMPQVSENLYHSSPRNTYPSVPPLRRSYSPSPVYFSLSLYPSPFLLYFLLSLLRLYLILLSGHGIFPSFFIFPVKPSLSFPRTFLGSSFLLAPLFAPIAHIPVRMHVCTRPLFDSRDITLSRGSFCDGGVYRGNALLSID